jgi:hypothetical protein
MGGLGRGLGDFVRGIIVKSDCMWLSQWDGWLLRGMVAKYTVGHAGEWLNDKQRDGWISEMEGVIKNCRRIGGYLTAMVAWQCLSGGWLSQRDGWL